MAKTRLCVSPSRFGAAARGARQFQSGRGDPLPDEGSNRVCLQTDIRGPDATTFAHQRPMSGDSSDILLLVDLCDK